MQPDFSLWWKVVTHISLRYLLLALVAFLVFYVFFKSGFRKRKIQAFFPCVTDYARDIAFSILSISIFASIAYLCVGVWRPFNAFIYGSIGQVSIPYHAFSFVWLFFLHDIYFYSIHRLMHQPVLFKHVHLIHHRSTNPTPWTAYAFHPMEALLEAGIIPLAAFTFPVHIGLFSLFMLFQILYNIYGHLGYEFWPRKMATHWLGRWINTSVAHNQHHKQFKGNYGLYTLIWDRLFGTLRKDYETAMETYGRYK